MRRTPLIALAALCAALLVPGSVRVHAQAAAAAPLAPVARVIVKYRADSALGRMQALAAPAAGGTAPAATAHGRRAQALGQRLGMGLSAGAALSEQVGLVTGSGLSSEQLARSLAAQSDVEYAVPDQRRHILVAPNDPYYTTRPLSGTSGGPVSGQWYLRAPSVDVRSSIDAEAAWNLTTGKPGVVVAVLDTGVRYDHVDLLAVAQGGNLLPGYDMIGPDVPGGSTYAIAGDTNGRDADASDPGDWVSQADRDINPTLFSSCDVSSSSWHGTQTTGLLGALTDNGVGMAGVGRTVRVLPVRVLGKCGGYDSDIVAGMRWAAGLAVPGVPTNPNPAKVINLSLGGEGSCSKLYSDAVAEVNALGVVVVASAGNSSGHAVSSPANCPGVIAVAGLRHLGTKVGFSDIGPEIALSAPGGNCVNLTGPCLYPILTTSNPGSTSPVSAANNGSIYTDAYNISVGTSFSAPLVSGVAALMLSANPSLTAAEVRVALRGSARAFPTTGATVGTPQCTAPAAIGSPQVDQGECYCTTATCGAGMLDAGAAVAAVSGLQADISVTPSAPQALQAITFSALPTVVAAGRSIVSYRWVLAAGGGIVSSLTGATDGVNATATASGAGRFSVTLTVTDNTGASSTTSRAVTVLAAPGTTPTPPPAASAPADGGGGGGGGALAWPLWLLAVALLALHGAGRYRGRGARDRTC